MAKTQQLTSITEALSQAREQYLRTVEQAEVTLEQARMTYAETARKSEESVATLESHLEMLEFFEQERRAALVRQEIAVAYEQHKATMANAEWNLKTAMKRYVDTVDGAATTMKRAFNAAAGYRE
jgi:hypothetical protein